MVRSNQGCSLINLIYLLLVLGTQRFALIRLSDAKSEIVLLAASFGQLFKGWKVGPAVCTGPLDMGFLVLILCRTVTGVLTASCAPVLPTWLKLG